MVVKRQYSTRQLLVGTLIVALFLAWLTERYLRFNSVPEAVHKETRAIALDMSSRLNSRVKTAHRMQLERDHLRTRIRALVESLPTRTAENDLAPPYVRQLPPFDGPLAWRFEVGLPADQRYRLQARLGLVTPQAVAAETTLQARIVPVAELFGRSEIDISLKPGSDGDAWWLHAQTVSGATRIPLTYSVSFGEIFDLSRQTIQLAVVYRDSIQPRKLPVEGPLEVFRLSRAEPDEAEMGVVVYLQPLDPADNN